MGTWTWKGALITVAVLVVALVAADHVSGWLAGLAAKKTTTDAPATK